jgi:hypothetical protein
MKGYRNYGRRDFLHQLARRGVGKKGGEPKNEAFDHIHP